MRKLATTLAAGLLAFAPMQAIAQLKVSNVPEKEIIVTAADGSKVTQRVLAETVVPGEEVIYSIRYTNEGADAVANVVLTGPIPGSMRYTDGSALGDGTVVTFSIDNGKSFAAPGNLWVKLKNGKKRLATADEYTNVRFKMSTAISAGQSGSVSYRAVLN